MVVDVGPGLASFGELEGRGRQRPECPSLEVLELRAPAPLEFLERSVVEDLELMGELLVELSQAVEGVVTQRSQQPTLGNQNA